MIDPLPAPVPPTRSEVAAAQRSSSVEVAKDRWNAEVENAVRWVQRSDWDEVRDGLESRVSNAWARVTGQTPAEEVELVKNKAVAASGSVAAAAKDAYGKASAQAQSVEVAAENKLLEARLRATREAVKAENKAVSALEAGKEKAKTIIGIVEDKVSTKTDGQVVPAIDPVAKALDQRYERPEIQEEKTVAELLRERFIPFDERDNTILRGL